MKKILIILLACLSMLPSALRAQGYVVSGIQKYHVSSVYYVTLQNAAGQNVNSLYAGVDGAIGAFLGDELRGASLWQPTGNQKGQGVFVLRVWGDEDDVSTATFRLRDALGLEYQIGSHAFAQGQEGTYGSPSSPLAFTVTPVTGISLPFTEVTLKLGQTIACKPTLQPASHSTLLTTIIYKYSTDGAVFSVSQDGFITAEATGKGTLTVKATPGDFVAQAIVKVEKKDDYVPVSEIKNNMTSTDIELYEEDQLQLDFTVLPENATDRSFSITNDYTILDIKQETESSPVTIIAKKTGKAKLVITSTDNPLATLTYNVTVKEKPIPPVTLTFATKELTASKLHDVELQLKKDDTTPFYPNLVELTIVGKAANGEPVATATMADKTGLKWTVRGKYVGQYQVKMKYNGKEQTSTLTLNIPAEYQLEKGWDWISLHAASNGVLPLKSDGKWIAMQVDANNKVMEIRSQKALLYNDPQQGFFGDIDQLTPTDGMYKVYSQYAQDATTLIVLDAGYDKLTAASNMTLPQARQGYTWITYPHEIDHSLATLNDYLSKGAVRGDLIIGRELFAEYDGKKWVAPSAFRFEAGKGYIYYSKSTTSHTIDWGPATLASEAAASRSDSSEVDWQYDARRYSDCMAVVASLEGITDPENYSVGAFVGDECRGQGACAGNGLMYITVSGQPGDIVSFRLCHKPTQMQVDIEGSGLSFSGHAGSHSKPVMLRPGIEAMHGAPDLQAGPQVFDLQGRRMDSSPCRKGLYIKTITAGDQRVTRKMISK